MYMTVHNRQLCELNKAMRQSVCSMFKVNTSVITRLEGFDGNWRRIIPKSLPDFSKLTMTQLAKKF